MLSPALAHSALVPQEKERELQDLDKVCKEPKFQKVLRDDKGGKATREARAMLMRVSEGGRVGPLTRLASMMVGAALGHARGQGHADARECA